MRVCILIQESLHLESWFWHILLPVPPITLLAILRTIGLVLWLTFLSTILATIVLVI
jgi:hypothetical protein